MHCKLQGILASHFSELDPFAGNLCVQFSWRFVRQRRGCLAYSFPHLSHINLFLSGIFMKLRRWSYPFPEEQFCSCLRTVRHPQAFRNLKNLSTVVFFFNFLPHLLITCWEIFNPEPARPTTLVFQMWQTNARAEESFGGFSVVQASPRILATPTEPLERCKQGHLHVPLLRMCDIYNSMHGIFKISKHCYPGLSFIVGSLLSQMS